MFFNFLLLTAGLILKINFRKKLQIRFDKSSCSFLFLALP
ncbi:hypothetical protein BLGI_2244 [Brevibacillus laterosporus GI-9]|nr:hypothetical protein BLGI_2244 [Brevibacillus laterosporus GI-9]